MSWEEALGLYPNVGVGAPGVDEGASAAEDGAPDDDKGAPGVDEGASGAEDGAPADDEGGEVGAPVVEGAPGVESPGVDKGLNDGA